MEDTLALSVRQFVMAWQTFSRAVPGHLEASLPGVELRFSGLPVPIFNVGVLTGEPESASALRASVRDAASWAAPRKAPWFLVATHEALAADIPAEAVLADAGFVPAARLTGMVADDVRPRAQEPEGLELSVPDDDASCADIMAVNGAAYGAEMSSAVEHLGSRAMWKDHIAVVGRTAGRAVSCSAVMMIEGYRYVCFVASHPDSQRRGYADAAMRRSLQIAAGIYGKRPTLLHATEAGRPVYEKMGYTPISTHTMFIESQFAVA